MKCKKILAFALALSTFLGGMSTRAAIDTEDTERYEPLISKMTFEAESDVKDTVPAEANKGNNLGQYYIKENDNVYWYGYRAADISGGWTVLTFAPTGSSELVAAEETIDGNTDRELIVESKVKFTKSASSNEVGHFVSSILLGGTMPEGHTGAQLAVQISNLKVSDNAADTIYFKMWGASYTQTAIGSYDFKANNWYVIRQVYDLKNKTYTMEIEDTTGAVEDYQTDALTLPEKDNNSKIIAYDGKVSASALFYTNLNTKKGCGYALDDVIFVKKINKPFAPVVDSLKVDGAAMTGKTLTAVAKVSDENGDEPAATSYQWQTSENGKDGWTDIAEAISEHFTVTDSELNKYLRVAVTPHSTVDPKDGETVYSDVLGPVVMTKVEPWIKEESYSVLGTAKVGYALTADYTYEFDSAKGDPEGNTEFIWEMASEEAGEYTVIEDAVTDTFSPAITDAGSFVRVTIIPVDKNGLKGASVTTAPVQISNQIELFVATDGNDENSGSIEAPFATVTKARDTIRTAIAAGLGKGEIVVNIRGGNYPVTTGISFGKNDAGTADCPIIYRAYNGEEVNFYGSKKIDAAKAEKVTDKELTDRLVEDYAKDKLYQIDLDEQGIDVPALSYNGQVGAQRIYMNGVPLTNARWPNDDKSGAHYFTTATPAELTAEEKGSYNGANQPQKLIYADEENRSEKWTFKSGEVYAGGGYAHLWSRNVLLLDTLDAKNKVLRTIGKSGYGHSATAYLYFENIFEEIDQPGESYIDRENNILYFYPIGDMEDAEMSISTLTGTLINNEGGSYITYDGINIRETVGPAILIGGTSANVTVQNATVNGISDIGIRIYGSNHLIQNCDIYNTAAGSIALNGGDRSTLTSSGTVITNNKIHDTMATTGNIDGMQVSGVGHVISRNEFYGFDMGAVRFASSHNVITEYNEIHDCQLLNADGGALYWGRNVTELGNVVRYNYFHNIGNNIGGYGQQSIFTDDGNIGPAVYGNIFYHAGTPNFPIKTHAGQFHWIHHNIIIDQKTGVNMQAWPDYIGVTDGRQGRWWLYITDFADLYNQSVSNLWSSRKDLILSDTWKEYYTAQEETKQWAGVFDFYNAELYAELETAANQEDPAAAKNAVKTLVNTKIPSGATNKIYDNVMVNVDTMISGGNFEADGNMEVSLTEGKALFEDYGTDFSLTKEGLAAIRAQILDFEDLDFDSMGLAEEVGGTLPAATDLSISGTPVRGSTLTANYTFTDEDGDKEGLSKVFWYVSDTVDGEYSRIEDAYGKYYTVGNEYDNKYIRFELIPNDVTWKYDTAFVSEPVMVVDSSNALLADLKVNGETVKGFSTAKYNYMLTLDEMPEITAEAIAKGAEVTITRNSEALPVKFVITVTALDGETKQVYQVAVSPKTMASPTPTVTPVYSGNSGAGSSMGGGFISVGNANKTVEAEKSVGFTDIIGHWAEADINEMSEKGIVSGVTKNTFEPDRFVTRAEFAALMSRALKLSAANDGLVFKDVASNAWYAEDVTAAAAAGLIVGYDGNFRPDDTITREEMAVVIMKAYAFLGKSPLAGQIDKFSDKEDVSQWSYEYVDQAVSAGLISGMGDNIFAPKENTTRAQVTSLISRLLEK